MQDEPDFTPASELPLSTSAHPGTGGRVQGPEDFVVDEIPAYLPCGQGDHTFAWIEKTSLTTSQAVSAVCTALDLRVDQCGYAGLKDKHGVTRQWLSLERVDPAAVLALRLPGITVLEAARHGNKLRTGHLGGNRFTVVLHGVAPDAVARAAAIVQGLSERGMPNYFGPQRFGAGGDNASYALRVLEGEAKPPRDKRRRRLLASALQSQLFNELLARRFQDGNLHRVIEGDVLQRVQSGGSFTSSDPVTDQQRLDDGEIVVTGPMCGPKMMRPSEGSPSRAWEDGQLARFGIEPDAFAIWGKLARGTRRPLTVPIGDPTWDQPEEGALRLRFGLPPGSYATVLLAEVTKSGVQS